MNVFLWVLQIVLAALFVMAGVQKAAQPKETLAVTLPWIEDFPANTVRFIGVAELLAAIGLILPAATGIATFLTPLAAIGLAVMMLLAANTHRRRDETSGIAFNAVVFVAVVVVAWGRFGPYSF